MDQYSAYNINSIAHGTSIDANGTNMEQYAVYNISSSANDSKQHITVSVAVL